MNRNTAYYIFCLIGIVIAFNVACISAVVPSLAEDLGISEFVAGRIVWAYMIPYGVCALFYGPLSRRVNIKWILAVCLGMVSLFNFLSGITVSFKSLFVYRFIIGVFASAMTPLTLLYIAHTFEADRRGKAVGTFFSITFASSLTGLFLSGIIPWRAIFLIPAVVSALTVVLIISLFPEVKIETDGGRSRYVQALKTSQILGVFIYIFIISFLYHLARQWMGVYLDVRFSFSQFVISSLLTLVSLAGIFGEFFGGMLADKKGRILTLSLGGLLMAVSLLAITLAAKILFLGAIFFLWGLGWTINHSGFSAYLTDLPKQYLQEVSSLNSSVRFLAGGLGAMIGGVLMQKSFTATFITVGFILLALSLCSKYILRRA